MRWRFLIARFLRAPQYCITTMIDNNDNDDYQNPHNYYSSPDFGFFLLFLFFPLFFFSLLSWNTTPHSKYTKGTHLWICVWVFFSLFVVLFSLLANKAHFLPIYLSIFLSIYPELNLTFFMLLKNLFFFHSEKKNSLFFLSVLLNKLKTILLLFSIMLNSWTNANENISTYFAKLTKSIIKWERERY